MDKVIDINTKLSNTTKVKEGLYIPSIEACWLYKANMETGDYITEEKYLDKLLKGKIDYSFELFQNKELVDSINIQEYDGKYYTLDIINVKYEKKYKNIINGKVIEEMTTKQLKDWTYEKGFVFAGKNITNWKRGSGKARNNENLFITQNIQFTDDVIRWGRMGLKFDGNVDISGIRAYESLPLSSMITNVTIDPSEILIVPDYSSKFDWKMSNTYLVGDKLETKYEEVTETNSIWDGEGLIQIDIIDSTEVTKDKAVILLRNRFMKCAAFGCYIDKYYKKHFGTEYSTAKIPDMYGNLLDVKSVRLITTPSSIKLSKYNKNVIKDYPQYAKFGEGAWLQYWKDNCGNQFSVCKTEKPSHNCIFDENGKVITYRNVLSYQHINTLPFTIDEIKLLLEPELNYISRLKNDLDFFLSEVNALSKVDIEQELGLSEDDIEDYELDFGNSIDVVGAFTKLCNTRPEFANTQVFKDYRRNFIDAYVKQLRRGKVHVSDTDYAVACGNPIELLKQSLNTFDGTSELGQFEIMCSRFDELEQVVGARNPHIVCSNWGKLINREIQDIRNYMRCTDNVFFMNSINCPILSVFSGEDFDIDCNLLTIDKTILDAVNRINNNIFKITHNGILPDGKNEKELTGKNMSDVDFVISQNYIGQVINLSMEVNSKINHLMYNDSATEEEIIDLFKKATCLNSISNTEIDKAKKQFPSLKVSKELEKIKKIFDRVDDSELKEIEQSAGTLINELDSKKLEIREYRKEKRKPILLQIRSLKKQLELNNDSELQDKIKELESQVQDINISRQDEIEAIKAKITAELSKKSNLDNRRMKPYFFKYIGNNTAQKQRKKTNKKHRREIDKPIIEEYCTDKNITIKDLNKNDKELKKLLKVNDDIQEKWENAIYDKTIKTPMNFLNLQLDADINRKKDTTATVQVITLVNRNKNRANGESVDYIVNNIKYTSEKIKGYRSDSELIGKERQEKIREAKSECVDNIRYIKLTKSDIYWILRECLNSVKNNGKVNKKSSIESLSLELLFKALGDSMLKMFTQENLRKNLSEKMPCKLVISRLEGQFIEML